MSNAAAKAESELTLLTSFDGGSFSKIFSCAASSCFVSTYQSTPSITWIANSPLASDGEILVDGKYAGWTAKGPLRVAWPWAVSLFRDPMGEQHVMFVYNLGEKSYRTYALNEEVSLALLMSYEHAVAVLKDGFFLVDLFAPELETSRVTATPLLYPLPMLCAAKSKEIMLCSMHDVQIWRFGVSDNRTPRRAQIAALVSLLSLSLEIHSDPFLPFSPLGMHDRPVFALLLMLLNILQLI